MAGDDDGDGVPAVGGTHGAGGPQVAQPARQLAVAQRRAVRDGAQGIPHAPLKRRPGGAQGQIERRACAGEILFQLSSSLGEQRARRAATVVLHPVLALERCRSVPGGREVDPGDTGVRGGEDELADGAGDGGESHGHWELDESDPEECSGAAAWSARTGSPYPSRREPRYHLSMHCHRAVRHLVLVAVALVVSCDKSTAPGSTVPLASVTVSPAVASVALGQTVQLTATPRDSQGNGLAGRVVAWSTSDASVATVSGSGLVTAVAVGGATITATSEGKSAGAAITVTTPSSGGTPDPTLLPIATTSQAPLTTAYDALNVPAIAAGGSYLDPTTGVKVYKITSATFPTSSPNWGHDYAEGGDEVSLPYNGNTRAVLVRQNGGAWWLVDFTPGVGVGNGRQLAGRLAPCFDQSFSFSNNPATPYYAYVSNCSAIIRFDIRTLTEAPGNGWPISESNACWLQQSENDGLFTWLRGQSGPTVAAFEPATNTLKTYTNSGVNEPRIDRAGRYIGLSMNSPPEALFVWDFTTSSIIWQTSGDPGIPFSHNASLRRRWLVVDWNSSAPHQYAMFIPDVANSGQYIGGPANANDFYGNGNWIQHPADLNDQWAVFSTMEGLQSSGGGWLAPGGMVLITPNGQRRLLGHPYNTGTNYTFYSFVRFAPDGRYVLFTSDMDGSGRNDVFLAELPSR